MVMKYQLYMRACARKGKYVRRKNIIKTGKLEKEKRNSSSAPQKAKINHATRGGGGGRGGRTCSNQANYHNFRFSQ